MSERSYNQYCPIAHALDLVGDRWALLIVRDLFLGPRRYTDIRDALPGTGSNILTARLKDLEAAEIVRRRVLPPPAASTVYELTPYGRRLEGVIAALGHWGTESLGTPRPGELISPESVMLAGRALFGSLAPVLGPLSAELHIEDASFSGVFGMQIVGGTAEVTRDPPPQADLVLRMDVTTLYAVASGRTSLREALGAGRATIVGTPGVMASLGLSNPTLDASGRKSAAASPGAGSGRQGERASQEQGGS